jgi:hypothetical protein
MFEGTEKVFLGLSTSRQTKQSYEEGIANDNVTYAWQATFFSFDFISSSQSS